VQYPEEGRSGFRILLEGQDMSLISFDRPMGPIVDGEFDARVPFGTDCDKGTCKKKHCGTHSCNRRPAGRCTPGIWLCNKRETISARSLLKDNGAGESGAPMQI
jgi:hypothetical protein